ncbi:MAG: acyltransferase 3 [Phycisphaerales bacterium]|nr:acyltransferase 3 [Phycisphaerales bacterium]
MAVLVIFSHSFPLATGLQLFNVPDHVSLGKLAVAVFFAISGYLIAMSWDRAGGPLDYMRRRVFRIYPGFIVAFILSTWLLAPLVSLDPASYFTPHDVRLRALGALLLHHVKGTTAFLSNPCPQTVNGSLWTISYEFWCYLGIALLGMAGLLRRRWVVLAAFVLAWATDFASTRIVLPTLHPAITFVFGSPAEWPRFLTWFLGGTTLYAFRATIKFDGRLAAVAGAALLATLIFRHGPVYVWPLAVPYLTFWFAFHPRINLWHVTRQLGGDYSYGMYLYAWPIQQLLAMKFAAGHPLLLFALATPLTFAAAVLSWRFVERPFLRRKQAQPVELLPPRDLVAAP